MFYNDTVGPEVERVLRHYVGKKEATVLKHVLLLPKCHPFF